MSRKRNTHALVIFDIQMNIHKFTVVSTHPCSMRTDKKKKKQIINYLFRFKLSVNPKYELRIFGIDVFNFGSCSTIFGFGDKLNPKFITQQLSRINITIQ